MRVVGFYVKLAQNSVYHPEMKHNPAHTRWDHLRRKVRDGSFFVLKQDVSINASTSSHRGREVELDHEIFQIQQSINRVPKPVPKLNSMLQGDK